VATKLLLVLHGLLAGVLTGAAIHNAHLALRAWWGKKPVNPRLVRLYALVLAVLWPLTMALGLVLYPPFRTGIRPDLEASIPWAIALFETKEHALAIGLALLAYVVPTSLRLDAGSRAVDLGFHRLACLLLGAVALFATVVGLLLSALRPV
jgi:hypothetical protein